MKNKMQKISQDGEKTWMKVNTVWIPMVINSTIFLPNLKTKKKTKQVYFQIGNFPVVTSFYESAATDRFLLTFCV